MYVSLGLRVYCLIITIVIKHKNKIAKCCMFGRGNTFVLHDPLFKQTFVFYK